MMLQYLRFDKSIVDRSEFNIIRGSDSIKFFIKRAAFFILFIYSTLFLAVSIPFEGTYYIGCFIILIYITRVFNHILKYQKYKQGKIIVDKEEVNISSNNNTVIIASDDIAKIEVNLLGNLVLQWGDNKVAFPLMLLEEEDRKNIILMFQDLSPQRTAFFKKLWDFFDAIFVAFILAMHIRQFIIQAYFIPTGSMEDTLQVGDHLLVEKITYGPLIPKMLGMEENIHLSFLGLREVQRGDIVIFIPPHDKKYFIKRCIAAPGDEFHIKNGSVYINNKKVDESYTKGFTSYSGFSEKRLEGKVPEGHIIVLGDNRENSLDSREFGYLQTKRIEGKAFILYWNTKQIFDLNFSRFGLIR